MPGTVMQGERAMDPRWKSGQPAMGRGVPRGWEAAVTEHACGSVEGCRGWASRAGWGGQGKRPEASEFCAPGEAWERVCQQSSWGVAGGR